MTRRTACAAVLALALVASASLAAAETTAPPRPASVDLGGTPVEGGGPQDPTTITAGLWSDRLTGPGSPATTRWFGYRRTMGASTVLVGVVATSPEDYGDAVKLEVSTPTGEFCSGDTAQQSGPVPGAAYGATLEVGLEGNEECAAAPELHIAVSRTSDFTSSAPFALRLAEEAPVQGDPGPEPAEETSVAKPGAGKAAPTAGGTSFDDAPTIDGTVEDEVPQGAERLWKVRLDWGQTLSWGLEVPSRPETEPSVPDPSVEVRLVNPLRAPFDGGAVDAETSGSYGVEGASLADTTRPVAYLNRSIADAPFVPGDYWVAVAVSPAAEGQPLTVPIVLTVEVTGGQGRAPSFPEAVTGPGGRLPPEGYAKATPYLVEDGVFSADVSGTPRAPGEEAEAEDAAADADVRRLTGLGVGAASLVSLLAGLVLLRRRTRISRAAAR